jgi:hypothetical protein
MRKLREQGHPGARWVGSERLGDAPPEKEQRIGIGGSRDLPEVFPCGKRATSEQPSLPTDESSKAGIGQIGIRTRRLSTAQLAPKFRSRPSLGGARRVPTRPPANPPPVLPLQSQAK